MKRLLNNSSILARLMRNVLGICAAAAVLSFLVIDLQIDRSLDVLRDQTVGQQAQTLLTHLKVTGDHASLTLPLAERELYEKEGPRYQYIVRNANGEVLFRSSFAYDSYFQQAAKNAAGKFQFKGPAGYDYVGYTIQAPLNGRTYSVQVAQTRQAADDMPGQITDGFMKRLLYIGVPLCLALLFIVQATLRGAFKPLYRISGEVEKVSVNNPDFQIAEEGVPDEIRPFITAINFSFRRLGKSLREQRELTENLAHELRTPLSVLKSHIEALGGGAEAAALSRDADAMIKLVNQMLDFTRLEYADMLGMGEFDLSALVSQVCQDLWPLFLKDRRELRVFGIDRPMPVRGNRDLIYRAVRNLLDNAREHTPSRTPVDVTIGRDTVEVRDYGHAIPEDKRNRIFERFHRDATGRVRPSADGAGLGLSIVMKTMEVHGGRALVEAAPDDGNIFRLEFPPQPAPRLTAAG